MALGRRGGRPGLCTAPHYPGPPRRLVSAAGRAAAEAGALGGEGFQTTARCPPARSSSGAAAAMPRGPAPGSAGSDSPGAIALLPATGSRTGRAPGGLRARRARAGRNWRFGTSPRRWEPFSRRDPLSCAFAGPGSVWGTHAARRDQAAAGPRQAWEHLCVTLASPAAASSPAGWSRCGSRACTFPPCRYSPFGGAGSGPLRRDTSGDFPAGEAEEAGSCSGPAVPLGACRPVPGLQEPGQGSAPVPADECQPRHAARAFAKPAGLGSPGY